MSDRIDPTVARAGAPAVPDTPSPRRAQDLPIAAPAGPPPTGPIAAGANTAAPTAADSGIELTISRVLRVGVLVALVLMLAGVVIGIARGPLHDTSSGALDALLDKGDTAADHRPTAAWRALRHLQAPGVITLGVLALVLTPFVRVIASVVSYARSRDRLYLGFTLAVIGLLVLSMALGAAG